MSQTNQPTAQELSQIAAEIYRDESNALIRYLQQYRPYICPLGEVIENVPRGARVMDVGCGAGLFLLLLARLKRISSGFGFDVSKYPIAAAQAAAQRFALSDQLNFQRRSIEDGIPRDDWPVVTSVDVLHHIPPRFQRQFVADLCAAVPAGGRLIIKDMVAKPIWRATFNRMHDLLMARQLVHHVDLQQVEQWVAENGLKPAFRNRVNIWWYGHWTLVADRPN